MEVTWLAPNPLHLLERVNTVQACQQMVSTSLRPFCHPVTIKFLQDLNWGHWQEVQYKTTVRIPAVRTAANHQTKHPQLVEETLVHQMIRLEVTDRHQQITTIIPHHQLMVNISMVQVRLLAPVVVMVVMMTFLINACMAMTM